MRQKFTYLLSLMLMCILGTSMADAANIYKIRFNGANVELVNGTTSSQLTFFSYNTAKHNFNTKFNGCTYDGVSYTSGLKMEGATKVEWTTTAESTVTIVQSTYSDKTIKFDGTELALADAKAIEGGRVYTITGVAAGAHSMTRGDAESGVFAITVEYTGAALTQLSTPSISYDSSTGVVTLGSVTNASKVTYTTDGTAPTSESTEYTAAFTVADGVTVKAIAIGDQTSYSNSDIASETVLLANVVPEAPVINQYNGTVAITCATGNSTIEYSLDGTTYNTYTRAFTLSSDGTVYARATRNGNTSNVASANVTTISKSSSRAIKTIWMGHGSFNDNTKNSMTGKSGDDAEGFTLAITGNTSKTWSSGNVKFNINGIERTAIKLSNGAQNTLTFPDGVKATRITFYSVINHPSGARTSYWKEFNGTNINGEDVPMGAWDDVPDRLTNPDTRVFELTGKETSITFTNAGEQLLFVIALDVIDPNYVEVTDFDLSAEEVSVEEFSTVSVSAENFTPSNCTDRTMEWTSSDASVATVNGGVITGVKAGTATITATSVDGPSKTVEVTVTPCAPKNASIEMTSNSDVAVPKVESGKTFQLTVKAQGYGLTYQWASKATAKGSYANISGATAQTYEATAVELGSKFYKVTVTNAQGSAVAEYEVKTVAPLQAFTIANEDGTGGINYKALDTDEPEVRIVYQIARADEPVELEIADSVEYAGVTYAVTVVGEEAFVNDMTVVGLETSPVLREIGARAFMACVNLADVELADGLEIIGDAAFAGCNSIKEFFIPGTVQYVGFKAFADCASLTDIYYDGTKAEWEALPNIKLAGIAKSVTIHFNDGETENGKGNIVGINNANADEAQKNGKFFENGELVIYKNGKAFTAAGAEKK